MISKIIHKISCYNNSFIYKSSVKAFFAYFKEYFLMPRRFSRDGHFLQSLRLGICLKSNCTIVLVCLFLTVEAVAQTTPVPASSQDASSSATFKSFQQERLALSQSFDALKAKGVSSDQLQAWEQQNMARLVAQQQRAMEMTADSSLEPQPLLEPARLSINSSSALKALVITRTALANSKTQIHNQLLNSLPLGEVSDEQIGQMQQRENQLFQQQQGANLQHQVEQAQILAVQPSLPNPLAPVVPARSTPQMKAFITLRDQLMREQMQMRGQLVTSTASDTNAALEQWHRQNIARFQQLQQLAQQLSKTTTHQ